MAVLFFVLIKYLPNFSQILSICLKKKVHCCTIYLYLKEEKYGKYKIRN